MRYTDCDIGLRFDCDIMNRPDGYYEEAAALSIEAAAQVEEWKKLAFQLSDVNAANQVNLEAKEREVEHLDKTISDLRDKIDAHKAAMKKSEKDNAVEISKLREEGQLVERQLQSALTAKTAIEEEVKVVDLEVAALKTENVRIKELLDAQTMAREAFEKSLDLAERVKTLEGSVAEAEERLRQRNICINDTLLQYYANVVETKGLRWLGEGYPAALADAWELILERYRSGGEAVDEPALKEALLEAQDIEILDAELAVRAAHMLLEIRFRHSDDSLK